MSSRCIIEQLCEASSLGGTLFLDTSGKDWLPASIYVPADAGDPYGEFVRQWGQDVGGQNPREIVTELVRRHGLVVISTGESGVEVLSRDKSPDFDEEQAEEIEHTFDTKEPVAWRPGLGVEPTRLRAEVFFQGDYDYVNKQPDRVAAKEKDQAARQQTLQQRQADKAEKQKPQPGGSRWNPHAPISVSKDDQDEFDALVRKHNKTAGLVTAPGSKSYHHPDLPPAPSGPSPKKPKATVYRPRFMKGGGGFTPDAKIRGL